MLPSHLNVRKKRSNVSLERPSADVAQVSNRLFVRGFPGTFTNGTWCAIEARVCVFCVCRVLTLLGASAADLRDLFEPFGKVLECTVLMRDDKKANKQVGLIR